MDLSASPGEASWRSGPRELQSIYGAAMVSAAPDVRSWDVKARVMLVLLGVVLIGAVLAVVVLRDGGTPPGTAAAAAEATEVEGRTERGDVLAETDRARLEAGLASEDLVALTAVLAPALAQAYGGTGGASLPAGSSVQLDAALFEPDGDEASVPMEVSGPEPGRWLLLLVREPGGPWLTVGTSAL